MVWGTTYPGRIFVLEDADGVVIDPTPYTGTVDDPGIVAEIRERPTSTSTLLDLSPTVVTTTLDDGSSVKGIQISASAARLQTVSPGTYFWGLLIRTDNSTPADPVWVPVLKGSAVIDPIASHWTPPA